MCLALLSTTMVVMIVQRERLKQEGQMREKNIETNCITEEKIAIKTVAGQQLCTVFKDIQCKFFPVGQHHYAQSNLGFMYIFF